MVFVLSHGHLHWSFLSANSTTCSVASGERPEVLLQIFPSHPSSALKSNTITRGLRMSRLFAYSYVGLYGNLELFFKEISVGSFEKKSHFYRV